MVFRYSWIAGAGSLLFLLYQLNGLLRPTVDGPPWQLIVVAALVLGIAMTWTVLAYRMQTWVAIVVNAVAATIAVARVAAPDTTFLLLPTAETFSVINNQLEQALLTVRTGIEPVIPLSGLVILLLVLFWAVGFLFAWGLSKGHPYVALLPPLVISLQFATMDRQPTGALRIGVFLALVAATLTAITLDQRSHGSGRMVEAGGDRSTRTGLSRSSGGLLAAVVVLSVGAVTLLGTLVPADGAIEWRSPTGLTGDFYGSVSYNPFIGIKQQLVSPTNTPVFLAEIEGNVPADEIYFSLLTMENYKGGQFSASRPQVVPLDEDTWVSAGQQFRGPSDEIIANVEILGLRSEWLPGAPTPIELGAQANIESAIRVRRDDGALRFEGGLTFREMSYSVRSAVPRPDIAALAVGEDGGLTAVFQQAAAADEPVPQAVAVALREEPPDVDNYLDLPEDLDEGIAALAREQTRNLESPFEKAIALESWFRSPAFRYSTDIETGHGATDLAEWLLVTDSVNHRVGYCENFATSMAVMARTLDIPSRVVLGFTPGTPRTDGTIIVRDSNAHAWVELWMPAQGWVRFDPTPRSDGINPTTFEDAESTLGFALTSYLDVPDPEPVDPGRLAPPLFELPGEIDGFAPVGGVENADGGLSAPGWVTSVLPWFAIGFLLFGAIPVIKWRRRRRRMRRLHAGDITAAWEEIVARLDDLGRPPRPADTPSEVAAKVDHALVPLATVYARSLYGSADGLSDTLVDSATMSLEQTEHHLAATHSRMERIQARYRIGTLLPAWWKRRRTQRR